jgi:hypothetical protein
MRDDTRWANLNIHVVVYFVQTKDRESSHLNAGYHEFMAKAKGYDFDSPSTAIEDEDEKTLAAIDEGIRDAEDGRTTPIDEVRKRLPNWITAS